MAAAQNFGVHSVNNLLEMPAFSPKHETMMDDSLRFAETFSQGSTADYDNTGSDAESFEEPSAGNVRIVHVQSLSPFAAKSPPTTRQNLRNQGASLLSELAGKGFQDNKRALGKKNGKAAAAGHTGKAKKELLPERRTWNVGPTMWSDAPQAGHYMAPSMAHMYDLQQMQGNFYAPPYYNAAADHAAQSCGPVFPPGLNAFSTLSTVPTNEVNAAVMQAKQPTWASAGGTWVSEKEPVYTTAAAPPMMSSTLNALNPVKVACVAHDEHGFERFFAAARAGDEDVVAKMMPRKVALSTAR
eukprot:TRINITY_DN4936_c0_g1_i1.p1 TRINITY_DN4936_c0_g1~~TRINITY_DN4936_c0_g1_i1.p1  ORF type:complete len:299 (+),score=79.88 TRINITY_DN4936_c0_g1_i1:170-1066(+)